MNKLEWAYLAGILDGEGSITMRLNPKKDNISVRVEISNSDYPLMKWIQDKLGGHLVIHERPPYKTVWKWVASGRETVIVIIQGCYPYMIVKRPQAYVVWTAMQNIPVRTTDATLAQRYVAEINTLNKKGGPQ